MNTVLTLDPAPNVELFGSLPLGMFPVNRMTWLPSVDCQITLVLLMTDNVSGVNPEFVTRIVCVSTGGLGPVVLLPPQAARAIAIRGRTKRTFMKNPPNGCERRPQ